MVILKHRDSAQRPKCYKVECYCGCVFEFDITEAETKRIRETVLSDKNIQFGGYQLYHSIKCPECDHHNPISVENEIPYEQYQSDMMECSEAGDLPW